VHCCVCFNPVWFKLCCDGPATERQTADSNCCVNSITAQLHMPHNLTLGCVHIKHEDESGTVRVPVYEFRQTRVCVYFNGGRSHTYEYGLPVNFTRTSSFCAGRVFIQLIESKLPVNSINIMYKSCNAYLTSRLTSS